MFGAFRNRKKTLRFCKRLLARMVETFFPSSPRIMYLKVTKWTAVFIFQNREERVLTRFQASFTDLAYFQVIYASMSKWSLLTDTASSAIFHLYKPHSLISELDTQEGLYSSCLSWTLPGFLESSEPWIRLAWPEGFCGRLALHRTELITEVRDEVHQSSTSDSSGLQTFYIMAVRFTCLWTG